MKKWITIVIALAAAWLVVFAVLHSRQSPQDDWHPPHIREALSKTSRRTLDTSQEFVLFSIDPNRPEGTNVSQANEKFHEYPILGQVKISDPKKRSELLSTLYKSVRKSPRGEDPGCFEPRHGIRAVSGTNWIELVICFECEQVGEYGSDGYGWTLIDKSPKQIFNRALQDAGLPLAK